MDENSGKRVHIESGTTPDKPEKKRPTPSTRGTSRKSLFFTSDRTPLKEVTPQKSPSVLTRLKGIRRSPKLLSFQKKKRIVWQRKEDVALVQFVALHKDLQPTTSEWPSLSPKSEYWQKAAKFIQETTGTTYLREGSTIRQRVVVVLKGKFKTVDQAEEEYGLSVDSYLSGITTDQNVDPQPALVPNHLLSAIDHLGESQLKALITKAFLKATNQKSLLIELATKSPLAKLLGSVTEHLYSHLPDVKKDLLLDAFFLQRANESGIDSNPGDFATLSIKAMLTLQQNSKPNLVYKWCRCLHNSEGQSSMDLNRMPFGLIQYCMEFFSCTHVSQIREAADYQTWQDTMDAEFGGGKFKRLFRGPMWSGLDRKDIGDPRKARANVPCVSTQTQNKSLHKSPFSTKPEIQMEAIKELSKSNPKGRYWIKADGTDVKPALQESVRRVWNGDVNLLDGKLENLRREYEERISGCETITASNGISREDLLLALTTLVDALEEDIKFLADGLNKAVGAFRVKFGNPSTSVETLKGLNWDIVEFQTLLEQASLFKQTIDGLVANLNPLQQAPVAPYWRLWVKESSVYLQYLRNLYKKKRICATHVLVFMLADEQRNCKPYAIPIQYVPYKGIRDQEVRDFTNKIKVEMARAHLKVVGTSTDGEFEQLRRRGETRPLHIWQIAHDSRDAVSKMSKRTLLQMLELQGVDANGHPIVARQNPAVPHDIIFQLADLRNNHMMSVEDAITFIRGKLVPAGYTPYPFRRDTPESPLDKLRSVVATCQFRHDVQYWKENGVDFTLYLYVPEIDPYTGDTHHERADHNHLLKRIAKHTRDGNDKELNYERFDEAMQNPMTGLTHAALMGARKQSVPDAEKLLSFHVAKFFRDHTYNAEAEYVETVAEWHESSDGRGLNQLQRSKQNYRMLNYILDVWIPWHRQNYDLSTLDINKPIEGLRGFSRETVIEVTTNIESQEFRRRQNQEIGYAENPRASETDDLECLYGMCHSWFGPYFTLKEFKQKWPKIVREFTKRMDPGLPFYYHTSNERFSVDLLPSFDEAPADSGDYDQDDDDPTKNPYRLHRLVRNTREDSSIFAAGRSFLPARNKTSTRQRFHRFDVGLPPVLQGQQL